jgi:hypothetical protein
MPAEDRNHGEYGQVLADPTGGAAAVQLVSLDKWDLDMTPDLTPTTCFEDPNKTYAKGKPDIKGNFSGQYDKSADGLILFSMIFGTDNPFFKLIPNRLDLTQFFGGLAIMSGGKISVDGNGGVTTAGSFAAADAWTTPVDPA